MPFASLWNKTDSRSLSTQKKQTPISSYLDETSLVTKVFLLPIPSGKDSAILPARVANHSAGFGIFK